MIDRRTVAFLGAIAAAAGLSGCMQLGQTSSPDRSVSNVRTFAYTAIGASDAVGYGSSVPCATSAVVVGADTVQMPSPASCPGGKGYVPDLAALLQVNKNLVILTDLGISGATIGPAERSLANTYEPLIGGGCTSSGATACAPGDFLDDELPLIPSAQNTVTIFAGGNDTNAIFAHVAVACAGGCTALQLQTIIGNDIATFGGDYVTLVGAVHRSFPFARIYLANLPNFGLIPRGVALGGTTQALLDTISVNIDANVINVFAAHGVPVIDLECDPRSYDPANFFVDGFHPDDSGYSIFAQVFAPFILNYGGPPPSGNCGVYSQAKAVHPFAAIAHVKLLPY